MQRQLIRIIVITSLFATLSACSSMPDWLGGDSSDDKRLEGKRIALLKGEPVLHADSGLQTQQVALPELVQNDQSVDNKTGDLFLGDNIQLLSEASIGKKTEEDYSLPTPVIAEGKLFVLDGAGNVIASSLSDISKPLWKTSTLSRKTKRYTIGGGIAYNNGTLLVTAGYEEIIALAAATGQELWRKPVGNIIRSAPAAGNDKVAVLTIDDHLYVFNRINGELLWTHEGIPEAVGVLNNAPPLIASGGVLLPEQSGELTVFNDVTGREIWSANLSYSHMPGSFPLNGLTQSPVITEKNIYVTSVSNGLNSLNPATGEAAWKQAVGDILSIWVGGDYIYAIDIHNELVCINAPDGRVKWLTQLPELSNPKNKDTRIIASGPVLAGGKLYVTLSSGEMTVVSPFDGKVVATLPIEKNVTMAPVVANGRLVVYSNDGKVQMFGGATLPPVSQATAPIPTPVAQPEAAVPAASAARVAKPGLWSRLKQAVTPGSPPAPAVPVTSAQPPVAVPVVPVTVSTPAAPSAAQPVAMAPAPVTATTPAPAAKPGWWTRLKQAVTPGSSAVPASDAAPAAPVPDAAASPATPAPAAPNSWWTNFKNFTHL